MDVKCLSQSCRHYLFVAIQANKSDSSTQVFLKALDKARSIRSNKLLSDNGKEFTDRPCTTTSCPSQRSRAKRRCRLMKEWHQFHPQLFHKRPYDRS